MGDLTTSSRLVVRRDGPVALLVAACALAACAPFLRTVSWFGDEGVLLLGAARMGAGERLYRDVFAFLPPGGYLLVRGWTALLGASLLSVRLLGVLVIAAVAALTFVAAARAGRSRGLAAALSIGWLAASQGEWTMLHHHLLTTALSLGAMLLLAGASDDEGVNLRPSRALLSGAIAGAATMVTQSRGGLALACCLVVVLLRVRARRAVMAFVAGALLVPLSCALWLAAQGTLPDAVAGIAGFAGRHYAAVQRVSFASFSTVQTGTAVAAVLATALLAVAAAVRRGWRPVVERDGLSWTLLYLASLLGTQPRPDGLHVAWSAPLALPLAAHALRLLVGGDAAPAQASRPPMHLAALLVVLGSAPALFGLVDAARATLRLPTVETARGPARLGPFCDPDGGAASLFARLRALPDGEPVFFYPYEPMLAWLSGRAQLGRHDIFVPGYTPEADYRAAEARLLERARWVVEDPRWTEAQLLQAVFPALADPDPAAKRALEETLSSAFEPAGRFGVYQLLRRRP